MEKPSSPSQRLVAPLIRHPVVTVTLALAVVFALVMSVVVGLDLFFTVPILGMIGALGLLTHRWWLRRQPADMPPSTATSGRVGMAAVAIAGIATFGIIQLVPYGRDHTAPPGSGEPQWATPRTRELMVAACFSCHSNETEYPAYASVAPISWMVQRHVDEGREKVDYSNFATDRGEAEETIEVIEEGEMPPAYYTRFGLHSEADLSDAELKELIAGLRATPGLADD